MDIFGTRRLWNEKYGASSIHYFFSLTKCKSDFLQKPTNYVLNDAFIDKYMPSVWLINNDKNSHCYKQLWDLLHDILVFNKCLWLEWYHFLQNQANEITWAASKTSCMQTRKLEQCIRNAPRHRILTQCLRWKYKLQFFTREKKTLNFQLTIHGSYGSRANVTVFSLFVTLLTHVNGRAPLEKSQTFLTERLTELVTHERRIWLCKAIYCRGDKIDSLLSIRYPHSGWRKI